MGLTRPTAWLLATSALVSAGLWTASPAFAAEPSADGAAPILVAQDTTPAAPAGGTKELEQIVVTGALRSQLLQQAPMAVTAVPSAEFTQSGFKEPRDLQFLSPSVQVSIQGANAIYIRGSGTNSQNGGTEQSVGLVLDGVLQGFVDDIGADVSDLDHAEVYRGPQGTQFAMNTSAGTVAMITKNPAIGRFETIAHVGYGTHNDTSDYITENVPISDTLAIRFTGSFQHRDGLFYNLSLGKKQGGREQEGGRIKILWKPKEGASFVLNVDLRHAFEFPNFPQAWGACGPGITEPFKTIYSGVTYNGVTYGPNALPPCNGALLGKLVGSPLAGIAPASGVTALGSGVTVGPDNRNSVESDNAWRDTEAGGASLNSSYALGDYTVTSITAYRFMWRFFRGPSGNGYYTGSYLNNWYNGDQFSEELRLSSPAKGLLTWVAGALYYDRDTVTKSLAAGPNYGQAYDLYPNTPYGAFVQVATAGGQQRIHNVNKSVAAYADGSIHFTDKLQLNLGGRVTHDNIYASIGVRVVPGVYISVPGTQPLPYRNLDIAETGYTWRVGPQYFITPDIQLYGTVAHGYKGPLIDTSTNVLNPILPEENNMLEAGFKSFWFEHRLTLDVTLFHEKYKNYQVTVLNQQVIPNVFQLGNAGGMLSKGVEFESTARVSDDWKVNGSFSYNDNYYTDFVTSCWNALEPIKQPTSGPTGCYVHPGQTAASAQAAGTPLINSSKWTWRVGANYTHDLNHWVVDANATYLHRSSFLSAPMDPNIIVPGYGVLNINGGITTPDGRYRFGFYVRNALNTFFLAGKQASNGGWTDVFNPEAVRYVGMNFDMRFD